MRGASSAISYSLVNRGFALQEAAPGPSREGTGAVRGRGVRRWQLRPGPVCPRGQTLPTTLRAPRRSPRENRFKTGRPGWT